MTTSHTVIPWLAIALSCFGCGDGGEAVPDANTGPLD